MQLCVIIIKPSKVFQHCSPTTSKPLVTMCHTRVSKLKVSPSKPKSQSTSLEPGETFRVKYEKATAYYN